MRNEAVRREMPIIHDYRPFVCITGSATRGGKQTDAAAKLNYRRLSLANPQTGEFEDPLGFSPANHMFACIPFSAEWLGNPFARKSTLHLNAPSMLSLLPFLEAILFVQFPHFARFFLKRMMYMLSSFAKVSLAYLADQWWRLRPVILRFHQLSQRQHQGDDINEKFLGMTSVDLCMMRKWLPKCVQDEKAIL